MVEQSELRRVMAIARANARDALNKDNRQRESYLGYCHNNWKRYAAGFSKRKGECDRFAATLDRATRDLVALADAAPNAEAAAEILRGEQPPDWADTIEGAMDSVITHEAHQETEFVPQAIEAPVPDHAVGNLVPEASAIPVAAAAPEIAARPALSEHGDAEEEDRLSARYGFRNPADEASAPGVEPPEHAQELQRKVRAVLLAHRPKLSG
jgi:hypothetical protein